MWLYRVNRGIAPVLKAYWRLRFVGPEQAVPLCGPLLIAANHTSYLDPWFIGMVVPRPVRYLITRSWYDRSPAWRALFRAWGTARAEQHQALYDLGREAERTLNGYISFTWKQQQGCNHYRERYIADAGYLIARADSGTPQRRVLGHRKDEDTLGARPQLYVVRNHHVGFDDLGEAVSQDVQVTAGEFVDHPVQHVVEVFDRRCLPDLGLVPGPDSVPVDAAQRRVEVLVADGLPDEAKRLLTDLARNRVAVLEGRRGCCGRRGLTQTVFRGPASHREA